MTASWDSRWEGTYAAGRQLNRYPFGAVVAFMRKRLPDPGARVLEIGCGAGNNLWFLAREGYEAAGIDGSPTAVAHARARLAAEGLAADLRTGDFARLPWPDGSFDAVIDRAALTHNRRAAIAATLAECGRVLRPGGAIFSMMYSQASSDAGLGRALGDGCVDDFSDGYFRDLSLTFFADRKAVIELFGPPFRPVLLEHVTDEDRLASPPQPLAHWIVHAVRDAGAP